MLILQDYHSLRNGSLDYSQADEPTYRVCVEPSNHLGTYYSLPKRCFSISKLSTLWQENVKIWGNSIFSIYYINSIKALEKYKT